MRARTPWVGMDPDGLGWRLLALGLPVVLVCASVPLLAAAAVLGALAPGRSASWVVAAAGAGMWMLGIAWGLLVNRIGPTLRPA